jgi:preprotein translocase subunit SecF
MIDLMKYRPLYAVFSCALLATFIGCMIYKYQTYGRIFVYSVDFTEGTQVLFGFSEPVASEKVLSIIESQDNELFKGAIVRSFSDHEVLIRVKQFLVDSKGLSEQMQALLEKSLPGIKVEVLQVDSVGASVGASSRWKSLQAIIIGLLIMLLYTWWRFWSLAFGIGVLVSLLHDVLVILLFFLLFDYEISLNVIAAVLMIVGYSINDTIVIFSRIRENIAKMSHTSIENIVNISTNETFRRTLLTSFATSLVVIPLVLFGGETLKTLSVALLIGIVFGTYSSISIASPTMLLLYKK